MSEVHGLVPFESTGGLVDSVYLNSISRKGSCDANVDLVIGNHAHHGACEPGTIGTLNGSVSYGGPAFHDVIPSAPLDHVCNVACTGVSTLVVVTYAHIYDLTGSGEDGLMY